MFLEIEIEGMIFYYVGMFEHLYAEEVLLKL